MDKLALYNQANGQISANEVDKFGSFIFDTFQTDARKTGRMPSSNTLRFPSLNNTNSIPLTPSSESFLPKLAPEDTTALEMELNPSASLNDILNENKMKGPSIKVEFTVTPKKKQEEEILVTPSKKGEK